MLKDENFIFVITLIAFLLLLLIFLINYYDLTKFKKCYDNNFNYPWCEKYKNY